MCQSTNTVAVKCPIEINLKLSDSDWSCTVYLQLKYLYDGAAKKTGASRAKPLGPWVLQEHEQTIELKTTTSKDEIVEMIRCAQRAALNPKDSPKEVFVSSDKPRYDQVPFSPNVVRVDISGRKLTNLSLYDLPGIVAQVNWK